MTLFGRYGTQDLTIDRDHYWSGGVTFADGIVFNPRPRRRRGHVDDLAAGDQERLAEGYYNFQLTERLRLSFTLQHVFDTPSTESHFSYLLPGIRLQAAF